VLIRSHDEPDHHLDDRNMIVSCAPFRVSFAGGGSDIAQFYRRERGAVLSCTIAKYSFAVIHPYFHGSKYHLKYARTELVDRIDDVQHPLLREALRMHDIGPGVEIVSVADIPSGTGLGSSSSFSVALMNALHAHRREFAPKEMLAREACTLEIERLGEPIGKQDQYAAAYGGVNLIEFEPNGGVVVQPLVLPSAVAAELEGNLMLFFTGSQREARAVLGQQVKAIEDSEATFQRMRQMVKLAYEMRNLLMAGDIDAFGEALHIGWELKRGVSASISNSAIDSLYERARDAGATGGKLAGAGGGGFLLLYCPKAAQHRVRQALHELQPLDFRFDWGGARIAFAQ
jgi:D-glycero-alpha-D-manno-heptose-7-phosphate kinase